MIASMMRRALFSGDGSTLTLDFTTGVLDSRLTFTRGSNATFINSNGLVQFAAVNEFRNTGWVTSTTPTGWNVTFGTGTTTWNNDGTLTMNTGGSSTRPCINATSFTVSQGIPYTFGYRVVSANGSPQISSVISSTVAGETFAINGTTVGGTTVVQAGDVVSCTFTPTTTSAIPRMGPGVNVGMTNTAMTITQPQMNPGMTLQAYRANSSTTAANNDSARFDHDPTTLAPKGLLIEGTATNLFSWSETFDTTGGATNWNWSALNVTRGTVTTTNPTGASATVIKVEETTANGLHGTLITPTVLASTTYTFSVWAKAVERTFVQLYDNGGSATSSMVNLSTGAIVSESTAGITTVTAFGTTGWYRISMRLTTIVGQTTANCQLRLSTNGTTTSYAGTTGSGIYIWGAQLEAGSGASSYIPTGASTGSRVQDLVSITSTNFSSWWTSNNPASFLVDISSTNRPLANHIFRIADSSGSAYGYQSYFNSTTMPMQVRAAMSSTSSSDVAIGTNLAANTRTKIGFTVETASLKRFRDGSLAHTLATPTLPPNTLTQMYIGGTSSFGNSSADFHIRQFKYWPITLSDAAMQGFTT